MVSPILSTKIFIPPARPDLLARPRLVQKLDESLDYPLTLISASAGSGKTTLLSEWVSAGQRPVAWVSLDQGDNNPAQLITYLVHALRTLQPDFGSQTLENLLAAQNDPPEMQLITLINELAAIPENVSLVLDDYHAISDQQVHDLLTFFLDHLPPQIHLVIASRIDPPFPIARYRAGNQVCEIRGQDLRFSVAEAAEFLQRTMGLSVSAEDVAALEQRTEGWIAGLQLAALSMQGQEDIPGFVKAFTGSHRYVAEYLIEEILKQLPDNLQSFMLQTSILDRLSANLCEAVADCRDGQTLLETLQHRNIFLIPLDSQGEWFRYHHLFADLLRMRLQQTFSAEAVSALHLRASNWFREHGELFPAVEHALASGDDRIAAKLVDLAGQTMVILERNYLLKGWLDALPESAFRQQPRLEIYRLMIKQSNAVVDMYEDTLLEQEALIKSLPPSRENDRLRREALVHLALSFAFQNTTKAIQIAEDALAEMPEVDNVMGTYLYSAFYRAYGMEGDYEKAAQAYRECLRYSEISGQYSLVANTSMIRTFDLCQYGRLDEAAHYCQHIIDAGERMQHSVYYPAGSCYIGLAGIHLERNQLEKAEEYLTRGIALCKQGAPHGLFTGSEQRIRLLQAQGKLDEALQALHAFEQTFQRREFTIMTRKVAVLLGVGDLQGAAGLVPTLEAILAGGSYAQRLPLIAAEAFKISLARIHLAQGNTASALTLLDEIETTVTPGDRLGRLMEVRILRSLGIQQQNGTSAQAIAEAQRALELAEGPGFVRLLVEEGPALVPLLRAVADRQKAPGRIRTYALKLLKAFGETAAPPDGGADVLIEPLTPRETEVLALIAAGNSNQQIAEKLVITVRTVKKHTSNIFGKLNVSSRTQAVAYARQIGLLPTD